MQGKETVATLQSSMKLKNVSKQPAWLGGFKQFEGAKKAAKPR